MMNIYDRDPRLARWAEVIVDFCTNVQPEERVEISGETPGEPLMLALYRRCLLKGASRYFGHPLGKLPKYSIPQPMKNN